MQTRDLIILLLLILVAAVVIALVVRRGNAKRAEEHDAEAEQAGTQAAWLGSGAYGWRAWLRSTCSPFCFASS